MSARRTLFHLAAKTAMVFAAIFVVTVLLAAMPGHHAPSHADSRRPGNRHAANQSHARNGHGR